MKGGTTRYSNITEKHFAYQTSGTDKYYMGSATGRTVGNTTVASSLSTFIPSENVECSNHFERFIKPCLISGGLKPEEIEAMQVSVHRSRCTTDSIFKALNAYVEFTKKKVKQADLNQNLYYMAKSHVSRMVPKKLQPISSEELMNNSSSYFSDVQTSAGYPYVYDKSHKKADVLLSDTFKKSYNTLKNSLSLNKPQETKMGFKYYRKFVGPCISYQKSAIIKPGKEEKVRLIWGYPLEMTTLEMQYAYPLIQAFKQQELDTNQCVTSYTLTAYSGKFEDLLGAYGHHYATVIDYSAFDTSVPAFLIHDVFSMLRKAYADDYINEWDAIEDYFINTPMLIPATNTLFVKQHGIPSGSTFTNLVGSLCNAVMMMYVQLSYREKPLHMRVMGDDNITIGGLKDLGKIAEKLKVFGATVNPNKCYFGKLDGAKFLGRTLTLKKGNFRGWIKDGISTLLSLAFPAHIDDDRRFFQRLYCLYLDNPVPAMWKMVLANYDAIIASLSEDFDSEQNRFVVHNVFSGDVGQAKKILVESQSKLLSPSMLHAPWGAACRG